MNTQFRGKKHSNEKRMPKKISKSYWKNSKTSGILVVGPSFSDKTYLLFEELEHETKQEGNGLLLFRWLELFSWCILEKKSEKKMTSERTMHYWEITVCNKNAVDHFFNERETKKFYRYLWKSQNSFFYQKGQLCFQIEPLFLSKKTLQELENSYSDFVGLLVLLMGSSRLVEKHGKMKVLSLKKNVFFLNNLQIINFFWHNIV